MHQEMPHVIGAAYVLVMLSCVSWIPGAIVSRLWKKLRRNR